LTWDDGHFERADLEHEPEVVRGHGWIGWRWGERIGSLMSYFFWDWHCHAF
jgi:hypothetical protein